MTPRLLAIQTKRIGDFVLTAPALDAWKEAFPDGEIVVVSSVNCLPVAEMIRSIDCAVGARAGDVRMWSLVLLKKFTMALDFTGTDRGALLAVLSGAAVRATYSRFRSLPLRSLAFNLFSDSDVRMRHTLDHHMDLVEAALNNGPIASRPLHLRIPVQARRSADAVLRDAGIVSPFFLLHPGAARPEKIWPLDRWQAVARHAAEKSNASPVVVSSPALPERKAAAEVAASIGCPCLAGHLDLREFAALIDGCLFQIGLDSAPMHFGSAFMKPQVALFGPTNPFHWHPRQGRVEIVSPGSTDGPFQLHHRRVSMEEIDVQAVVDAVDRILVSNPPATE